MSKLITAIVISWLVGGVCGFGIAQAFTTNCDDLPDTEQQDK